MTIRPHPPRFKRADLGAHIPYIQVRQAICSFSYYLVIDSAPKPIRLFRKWSFWPDRHKWKQALHLGWRLDQLLEDCYQRGLNHGMRPDEARVEPQILRDDGVPYFLRLFPFFLRRRGKTKWLIACGGWVAELKSRSRIDLEVLGWCESEDTRPVPEESSVKALPRPAESRVLA